MCELCFKPGSGAAASFASVRGLLVSFSDMQKWRPFPVEQKGRLHRCRYIILRSEQDDIYYLHLPVIVTSSNYVVYGRRRENRERRRGTTQTCRGEKVSNSVLFRHRPISASKPPAMAYSVSRLSRFLRRPPRAISRVSQACPVKFCHGVSNFTSQLDHTRVPKSVLRYSGASLYWCLYLLP